MSEFTIEYRWRENPEPFSHYHFDVLCDGSKVAELAHDCRGELQRIRRPGGVWKPVMGPLWLFNLSGAMELSPTIMRAVENMLAS